MKDSGVEWLGEIPAYWRVAPLKHCIGSFQSGGTPDTNNLEYWTDEDNGIPWVAISDMTAQSNIYRTSKRITESGRQSKSLTLIRSGALLYSMYASLGKVAVLRVNATVNQAILGIEVSEQVATRDFVRRWLEHIEPNIELLSSGNTQENLNAEKVRNIPVFLPPLSEQRAIADFLDAETGRIDALVEKKQRLVELLKDRRQAVITQAVTKGLYRGVAMRDSGIEWLGKIPAHWEVKRLKHVGSAKIGLTYSPANIVDENDGMIVLRASNIQNGKIVYADNVFVNSKIPSQLILHKGDVLICSRNGSRDLIGKNAMIDCDSENVTFGAFMTAFRSEYNDYIYQVFNSALFQYHIGAFGTSTVNQITLDILLDLKVPFPPLPEQRAIADYLDAETTRIDALVSKIQRQIELLNERRQAVITAAVTGKLDLTTIAKAEYPS